MRLIDTQHILQVQTTIDPQNNLLVIVIFNAIKFEKKKSK